MGGWLCWQEDTSGMLSRPDAGNGWARQWMYRAEDDKTMGSWVGKFLGNKHAIEKAIF
jgi:hypothetical protein